ncbi:uncharacterized protein Inos isoform X2 [Linepithema humile]|uniref:uncharacterized protein Inos isoform X2 n=1 Tax=Linepithema humile TaxID=83485 RepID=UPI00351EEF8B
MSEGGDVKEHIAQFFDAVDKLESIDIDINGDLSIMLLYSLPSSYENFRCAIESRDALPTAEQLKVKIIEEYEARNQVTINESGAMLAHRGKYNANAKSHKNTPLPRNEAEGKASARFKFKCSFCKIPGHKYADCRKRKKQATEKTNSAETETFYADVAQYSSSETPKHTGTSKWCLDSGCTSHLCKDTRMISKQIRMQSDIKLANSATSMADARGDVEFITAFKNRNKTIRLENTLHVPDLRTNLLSVAKIVDRGYRVTFDSNQATVYDPQGNTSLVVKREGDLYLLEGSTQRANTATQKERSDLEVWHERLGHLNTNDILQMSRTQAASGFELKGDHKISSCKVIPTSTRLLIRTMMKVPKLGLMLVGWGGNNGSTMTAALLANKLKLLWETKEGLKTANWYGSLTQASTVKLGRKSEGEDVYVPISSMLPMVNPNDIEIDGWDISDMNLAEAMMRAKVLDINLQVQLRPYMMHMRPRKSIYYPDFIASNQGKRANNIITGTKAEQLNWIRNDIVQFKASKSLDQVIVLWTANTERFSEFITGVNDTADNLLEAIDKNHSEISPSTMFAVAAALEGCTYINGSPQNTFIPGALELAERQKTFVGGDDFKSGQTKLKSVLVDFLVSAGIKPVSIVSYNHLGNNDGYNLSAPQQFRSKEISKSNVVDDIVESNKILYKPGEKPDHCIVIKYVPYVALRRNFGRGKKRERRLFTNCKRYLK